jgi:hypothetical protein
VVAVDRDMDMLADIKKMAATATAGQASPF